MDEKERPGLRRNVVAVAQLGLLLVGLIALWGGIALMINDRHLEGSSLAVLGAVLAHMYVWWERKG